MRQRTDPTRFSVPTGNAPENQMSDSVLPIFGVLALDDFKLNRMIRGGSRKKRMAEMLVDFRLRRRYRLRLRFVERPFESSLLNLNRRIRSPFRGCQN